MSLYRRSHCVAAPIPEIPDMYLIQSRLRTSWAKVCLNPHRHIPRAHKFQASRAAFTGVRRAGGRPKTVSASEIGDTQRSLINVIAEGRPGVPMVVLKRDKAILFARGNPMVYSGAIDCVIGRPPPIAGDAVMVVTPGKKAIAWGVYNPVSMFSVRVLQTEQEAVQQEDCVLDMQKLIQNSVRAAANLRAQVSLPSSATNVYRLINSEGDRLSGLTVDVLGSCAVVQSCAAWTERYRQVITDAVVEVTGLKDIVWRPAWDILSLEGVTQGDKEEGLEGEGEGAEEGALEAGASQDSDRDKSRRVQVVEQGVRFWASPYGQKTGFYADQRDSRSFLAATSRGKSVLDLCCYSGAFGVAAAVRGATDVTGVDSSAAAVELATDNAALNEVAEVCTWVRADIADFMKEAAASGRQWDIVVLDPPKLAPNKRALERASVKYSKLNTAALQLVKRGGLLMTCSCSGAMTQSDGLQPVVMEAARKAQRQLRLLRHAGPGPDHPLDTGYPEGEYLSNLTFHVT